MNKKILIEKIESKPLSYQRDESDKFLGFLEGIAADSNEKTRNGRRYPIELWRNVENSPEFREAMETQTCFGEADHPFDERVDTSIKEVAIVLLSFEIKNDGTVYCRFGILDTPNGRLLKSILDSGCQIGVSSRGIGEEITRNGEVIIDPDTYVFYGFDAVVMPAVVSARPVMTESVESPNPGIKSLSESFNREIESASTKSELESMLRIAENINSPEIDSIKESINIKLDSMSNGENISSKLESDLGVLAQENEDLKSKITELESIIAAKNIRIDENMKVIRSMRDNSKNLSKAIRESKVREIDLCGTIEKNESTIARMTESVNLYRNRGRKLTSRINEAVSRVDETKSRNDRLKNLLDNKSAEISKLNSRIDEAASRISRMESRNKKLEGMLSDKSDEISRKNDEISRLNKMNESLRSRMSSNNSAKMKIIESKDSELDRVRTKLSESNKNISAMLAKYLKTRCLQENLDYESILSSLPKNYTTEDVDRIVKEFSDRRDRLNKMPMRVAPRKAVITESYPHNQEREEDIQTMSILKNMK